MSSNPQKPLAELSQQSPEIIARRGALKKLLTGAGVVAGTRALPDTWVRPSISSVVLPSHAQATTFTCVPGTVADVIVEAEGFDYAVQSPVFDAPDGTSVTVEVFLELSGDGNGEVAEGPAEGNQNDPLEYTRVIENGTINEVDGFFEFDGEVTGLNIRYSINGVDACIFEQDVVP